MKNLSKGLLAIALMAICGVALLGCGTDPMDAKLTETNYNAIVVDESTYDDVVALFGEPEDDQVLTAGAGSITWKNNDETKTVTLTFENSIVTEKAQTGLL